MISAVLLYAVLEQMVSYEDFGFIGLPFRTSAYAQVCGGAEAGLYYPLRRSL